MKTTKVIIKIKPGSLLSMATFAYLSAGDWFVYKDALLVKTGMSGFDPNDTTGDPWRRLKPLDVVRQVKRVILKEACNAR